MKTTKRWKPKGGDTVYFINGYVPVLRIRPMSYLVSDKYYFRIRREANAALTKIRKILKGVR